MSEIHLEIRDPSPVGTLDECSLRDLLGWCQGLRQSAMIRVGLGLEAGVVFVYEGEVFRCEWGHLVGEQALFGLLALRVGTYSLVTREIPRPHANVHTPTADLLGRFDAHVRGIAPPAATA